MPERAKERSASLLGVDFSSPKPFGLAGEPASLSPHEYCFQGPPLEDMLVRT